MNLKKLFLDKVCYGYPCGTQRCDGSDEWIEGCSLYKRFADKIDEIKDLEISEFEVKFEKLVAELIST